MNLWDLKNENIEECIIKTHEPPFQFKCYYDLSDLLIIPFRKKSKILQTAYFQQSEFDPEKSLDIDVYKGWLTKSHNNYVFGYDYVLNIINYFSLKLDLSKKAYNIFKVEGKYIAIIDTQNNIPDEFFMDIYEIHFGNRPQPLKSNKINVTIENVNKKFDQRSLTKYNFMRFKNAMMSENIKYDSIYNKIVNK